MSSCCLLCGRMAPAPAFSVCLQNFRRSACTQHWPLSDHAGIGTKHRQEVFRAQRLSSRSAFKANSQLALFEGLAGGQKHKLELFLRMILEHNKHTNLTAVQDWDKAKSLHIEDSLAVLPVIQQFASAEEPLSLLDVGSGAGLPGLVLAVAQPRWQVALLDSLRKRCSFLELVRNALQLDNLSVVWSRAETAGQARQHRERYDVVVARAVAKLDVLAELCLPFVRPGGHWVAMKGPNPQDEVRAAQPAISLLRGGPAKVLEVAASDLRSQCSAVVVRKEASTPQRFPREAGIPKKRPLCSNGVSQGIGCCELHRQ